MASLICIIIFSFIYYKNSKLQESQVKIETTWYSPKNSNITYVFGSGNPQEISISRTELENINKWQIIQNPVYLNIKLWAYEKVWWSLESTGVILFGKPAIVTPRLEYMILDFLKNPLIQMSSEKCGSYFFTYSSAYSIFWPEIWDILNWWNPYNIDINTLIIINPETRRKEFLSESIYTLKTQLSSWIHGEDNVDYPNKDLQKCLSEYNLLDSLRKLMNNYENMLDEYGR